MLFEINRNSWISLFYCSCNLIDKKNLIFLIAFLSIIDKELSKLSLKIGSKKIKTYVCKVYRLISESPGIFYDYKYVLRWVYGRSWPILCHSVFFQDWSLQREISNIDDRKVQWRAVMDASAGPKHWHLPQSFEGRKKSEGCPGYSLDYYRKKKREIARERVRPDGWRKRRRTTWRLDPRNEYRWDWIWQRRARGSLADRCRWCEGIGQEEGARGWSLVGVRTTRRGRRRETSE